MTDLRTNYLGIALRSPIVASAGPLTGHVDTLAALEDAGAAAVVLPSLFEEEVVGESLTLHDRLEAGTGSFPEASGGFFPDMDFYDLGTDRHVRLVEAAKRRLTVPVVASVNAHTLGGWTRFARLLAEAGADAIELNVYDVATDPDLDAATLEDRYLDLVREVRATVPVPLTVKLSPYFTSLPNFARRVVAAGAQGLVCFNRFYQPDLSLDTLQIDPRVDLSTSRELRLPLRWTGILRPLLPHTYLAVSGGVQTAHDAAKALLVGADVVCMTSALLRHGPAHVQEVERELALWMLTNDYRSVAQLRGSVARDTAQDASAYERANYVRVLSSYVLDPNGRGH